MNLYRNLFYSPTVDALYTDEATVGYLLRFEAALARAQATHGLIPHTAADVIEACCQASFIDLTSLTNAVSLGGNAAIPLVNQLTALVGKRALYDKESPDAESYVHFGATSQDVIDTATMLQTRDAVRLIRQGLQQLITQLDALIQAHDHTPMAGRTLLQQAKPITVGHKLRTWLDGLTRSATRIDTLLAETFALQLGGAVGDRAALGTAGDAVAQTMANSLDLTDPPMAWHTQRDRITEIAAALGMLTGALGKLAKDVSLLMQTEIGEMLEPPVAGKGGSSAMPHKRNPVSSVVILAIAQRVPPLVGTLFSCLVQDHERASGAWHAEWEPLAELVRLTAGAVHQALALTNGLIINADLMAQNLDITNGLLFAENVSLALAPKLGKAAAQAFVENACRVAQQQHLHLLKYLQEQPLIQQHLPPDELADIFSLNR